MKPSPLPKPDGWSNASNGTTCRSTAAGLIWPNPNSLQIAGDHALVQQPIAQIGQHLQLHANGSWCVSLPR